MVLVKEGRKRNGRGDKEQGLDSVHRRGDCVEQRSTWNGWQNGWKGSALIGGGY